MFSSRATHPDRHLSPLKAPNRYRTQQADRRESHAIKDVYSNKVVGYSISDRLKSRLAVDALESAVRRRGGKSAVGNCIVHSDRGSQFRSRKFVAALHRNGLRGSMGRVAAAGDNAAMESFFALLQKNVLNRKRWGTRDELCLAIVSWIERTCHH